MDCDRCKKTVMATIMSRFNTDIICLDCERVERDHPKYPMAANAELDAIRRGDMNFKGIGKPEDL